MRASCVAAACGVSLGLTVLTALPAAAQQQVQVQVQAGGGAPAAPASVQAIEDGYQRQLLELDRQRVAQVAALAASQKPADAASTYEHLFRLAIAGNLFREAEAAAAVVVRDGSPSPAAGALAYLVKAVAEADRGAFDASLATVGAAFAGAERNGPKLLTSEVVSLCDAYYQHLVQADRFDVAAKAFRLALGKVEEPGLRAFLEGRLKRLDLIGKAAPAIEGKDLDGRKFALADARGEVVLVVFWATWCPPSAGEAEWLKETSRAYRGRGFRVVGVNMDASREGSGRPDVVVADVRRFLLDHNVTWPTLVNGPAPADFAAAYGVTDIPANVLIAKDGTVAHVDLVHEHLDDAIARELAR